MTINIDPPNAIYTGGDDPFLYGELAYVQQVTGTDYVLAKFVAPLQRNAHDYSREWRTFPAAAFTPIKQDQQP